MVTGRRTSDLVEGWDGTHPFHDMLVFVLTHTLAAQVPRGATPFPFVTDGIASAITQIDPSRRAQKRLSGGWCEDGSAMPTRGTA